MKVALLLLAICACGRRDRPEQAPPVSAQALDRARAEFELVPASSPEGMCTLFWRADVLADRKAASDIGDFVGRLQTLFGRTADHEYALRDKATGLVITASAISDGPAYRGHKDFDDATHRARIAADPVLAHGPPTDPREMDEYSRHAEQAAAGPALTAAVTRLEALIETVPPADWETTDYFHSLGGVFHLGAKRGTSFATPLPAARSIAFLLDRAEKAGPGTEADLYAMDFYLGHQDELESARPRVVALFQRFESAANARPPDVREGMLQIAEGWRRRLHL